MTRCPAGGAEVEMAELYVKPGERAGGYSVRTLPTPPDPRVASTGFLVGLVSHTSLPSQAIRNAAGTTLRSSRTGCRRRLVDPDARPLLRGSQPRRMDPLEVRKGRGRNPVRKVGVWDKPVPSACFLPRTRLGEGLGSSTRHSAGAFRARSFCSPGQ